MQAPSDFVEKLDRYFGGKYRIRWSDARQEWHIEQKVRRALAEGFVNLQTKNARERRLKYDDLIRARDGYIFVMAIKPGTTTYCHDCNYKLKVPAFDTAVIVCPYCRSRGRLRHTIAGYFPISDTLIDHLKRIDPDRGGHERVNKAMNRSNEMLERDQLMRLRRHVDAGTRERFNRLVGIPQWGYTGKEKMWER